MEQKRTMALESSLDDPRPPETESPRERFFPKVSIRSLIILITVSALIAWAFRTGFQGNWIWVKSFSAVICVTLLCFASYIAMFFLTLLFSRILQPFAHAAGLVTPPKKEQAPTLGLEALDPKVSEQPDSLHSSASTPANDSESTE